MAPNERDVSTASTTRTSTKEGRDQGKAAKPDFYYGDRNKLEDWVNQVLTYIYLEKIPDDKQAILAASFLRGEAQHWIGPRLTAKLLSKDFADDPERIFESIMTFVDAMRAIFGLSNDRQTAIRHIQHIEQKTSASQYTAKFKEYAAKTGWGDDALKTMYYRGLKESLKDELLRVGPADTNTLAQLQMVAITIDDKLYERFQEKRHTNQIRGRSGFASNGWTGGQQRRDPDAMELDATQQRPRQGKGRGAKGKGKGKKREDIECYNCHKKGHIARDCRGPRMRPQQRKAVGQPREVNVMTTTENEPPKETARGAYDTSGDDHRALHWTFCYNDSCTTHWSSKNDAGWFPSKPRREVNVIQQGPNAVTVQYIARVIQEYGDNGEAPTKRQIEQVKRWVNTTTQHMQDRYRITDENKEEKRTELYELIDTLNQQPLQQLQDLLIRLSGMLVIARE